jgi:hypothetical protein
LTKLPTGITSAGSPIVTAKRARASSTSTPSRARGGGGTTGLPRSGTQATTNPRNDHGGLGNQRWERTGGRTRSRGSVWSATAIVNRPKGSTRVPAVCHSDRTNGKGWRTFYCGDLTERGAKRSGRIRKLGIALES